MRGRLLSRICAQCGARLGTRSRDLEIMSWAEVKSWTLKDCIYFDEAE